MRSGTVMAHTYADGTVHWLISDGEIAWRSLPSNWGVFHSRSGGKTQNKVWSLCVSVPSPRSRCTCIHRMRQRGASASELKSAFHYPSYIVNRPCLQGVHPLLPFMWLSSLVTITSHILRCSISALWRPSTPCSHVHLFTMCIVSEILYYGCDSHLHILHLSIVCVTCSPPGYRAPALRPAHVAPHT